MSTALIPVDQIQVMAAAVAKSNLFGVKTPEQAMALMLIAQAEGLHPAIAARDFHVIQGRPALKADAMLARFQAAGGKVEWHSYTPEKVEATFSHPQGGSVKIEWTMAMAKAAGLGTKDVWKQYPRAMLRARVISEGIRTVYPGVAVGVYTPEETEEFDAKPPRQTEKDMGPAVVVESADDIIKQIEEAKDENELHVLAAKVAGLTDPADRKRVIAAGKKRLQEVQPPPAADTETGEMDIEELFRMAPSAEAVDSLWEGLGAPDKLKYRDAKNRRKAELEAGARIE